jgi:tryptophan-rich sensory protein
MRGIASKGQLRMSFLRYALVTVPLVLLLGTLSGKLSDSGSTNPWFAALEKPEMMPPSWAFPAAWTALYVLLGIVLAMILHARGSSGRGPVLGLFAVQLLLNYAWPPVFFAMHRPVPALILILAMIGLSVAASVLMWSIRKSATLLMLPYLAWLCFAAMLNYEIVRLNPNAAELVPGGASADISI